MGTYNGFANREEIGSQTLNKRVTEQELLSINYYPFAISFE